MNTQPTVLVVGLHKTGTTIIAHTVFNSIAGAEFSMEPKTVSHFEELGKKTGSKVVKLLFNHWDARLNLLEGICLGETGFVPDRKIAIVRDPRDGAISKMLYHIYGLVINGASRDSVEQWIKVIEHKQNNPQSVSVVQMLESMSQIFGIGVHLPSFVMTEFGGYADWLARHKNAFYILRYEDFIDNEIRELEEYLGFTLAGRREVPTSVRRVQRSSGSGNWKHMMLPSDIALLRDEYGSNLAQYGYDDWDLSAVPYLNPAHGSEYVRRIAEEAFTLLEQREQRAARAVNRLPGSARPVKPKLPWYGRIRIFNR